MHTEVDGGALTGLDDFVLQLLLHLRHHLFDAGRVNTAVSHQLVQGQTTGLASNGVEGRDDDSLRGVVDNNFHAAGSLQGTNVSSFTTNDTALHVIIVNMEHAHAVFHSRLRSHALNGLDDNLLRLGIGIELRLVHNFVDIRLGIGLRLVLQRLHQTGFGFLCTQSRQFLELGALLHLHLLQLLLLDVQQFLFVVDACLEVVQLVLSAPQLFLLLVERQLTLLLAILVLLQFLVALLRLLLQLCLLVQEFLLHLQQFLLFQHFCRFFGSTDNLIIFPFDNKAENHKTAEATHNEGCRDKNNTKNYVHKCIYIELKCSYPSLLGFAECILHFPGKPCKNIFVGQRIIAAAFLLVLQGNVQHRHQRYHVVVLLTFIDLRIGIVAVGDVLRCLAIVLLVLPIDAYCNLFVVEMQSDM